MVCLVLISCLLLGGDKPRNSDIVPPTYRMIVQGAIKVPLPDVQQPDDYSCGAAALMSICSYYGVGPEDIDDFKKALHTNKKTGTIIYDMVKYAKDLGLDVRLIKDGMTLDQLKAALNDGTPVIISMQAYGDPNDYGKNKNGHYIVAIGTDADDNVFFMDPSCTGRRAYLSWPELDRRWHENEGTERHPDVHSHLGIVIGPDGYKAVYSTRARRID
jgi:predicted double-glycine peptidase